jgi:hypothetical protein
MTGCTVIVVGRIYMAMLRTQLGCILKKQAHRKPTGVIPDTRRCCIACGDYDVAYKYIFIR